MKKNLSKLGKFVGTQISSFKKNRKNRDFGDERAVEIWSQNLQRTSNVEEKFILYKLLIELYEERNVWFYNRPTVISPVNDRQKFRTTKGEACFAQWLAMQ